jgi:hypothetical protein
MSNDDWTEQAYWRDVASAADDAAENVRDHGQDASEAINEAADGSAWVIYTFRASQTMTFTDNADAFEEYGFTFEGKSWGEIVSICAACAFEADVRDYFGRHYNEDTGRSLDDE